MKTKARFLEAAAITTMIFSLEVLKYNRVNAFLVLIFGMLLYTDAEELPS